MPPKRVQGTAVGRPAQKGGYASQIYNEITNQENRSVVTSLTMFALGVAFLHSSWSEVLLPPL